MQGSILNGIYKVESPLSQRGSRATWLAKKIDTDERIVIKILKFGLDAQWSDFRLFEREAQTLKNINHSAIPNYLDYFELDLPDCQGFALVQEYIAVPSIEETIKAGRTFSELEIKEIAESLLNILLYLHQQQPSISHRDIKPSNILIADRSGNSVGQVYLIDFGAVKNVAAAEGGTITVVGTYGYMPPEQFGGYTTPASDLYSLGATLIYLATGRHPTELPSKDGKIIFADSVQLSYSSRRWLEQMIEPSCDKRFSSAVEASIELQQPQKAELKPNIVKQPSYSKIVLKKTADTIEVIVPAPKLVSEILGLAAFAVMWNCFLVVWTGGALMAPMPINVIFSLFSIPFWLAGLAMIGKLFFTLNGKTKLKIDKSAISLGYECLGCKYSRQKALRADIAAIESVYSGWQMVTKEQEKIPVYSEVVIWANGLPYRLSSSVKSTTVAKSTFNYNPASIELDWLAKELSEWLSMPLTKTAS
ncbi:MAG: serine/threonine-protein kinase [Cyanobacteria bacterium J06629_2]